MRNLYQSPHKKILSVGATLIFLLTWLFHTIEFSSIVCFSCGFFLSVDLVDRQFASFFHACNRPFRKIVWLVGSFLFVYSEPKTWNKLFFSNEMGGYKNTMYYRFQQSYNYIVNNILVHNICHSFLNIFQLLTHCAVSGFCDTTKMFVG